MNINFSVMDSKLNWSKTNGKKTEWFNTYKLMYDFCVDFVVTPLGENADGQFQNW